MTSDPTRRKNSVVVIVTTFFYFDFDSLQQRFVWLFICVIIDNKLSWADVCNINVCWTGVQFAIVL